MVFLWLAGDLAKLLFYVLKQQPVQFIFCATFQSTFDALILAQFAMFRRTETDEKVANPIGEA